MQPPIVVYSTASYPPHPPHVLYTVLAGALKYAERLDPGGARGVDIVLLPITVRRRPLRRSSSRSLAMRATRGGDVAVRAGGRTVRVTTREFGVGALWRYAGALAAARRLWRECFAAGPFDAVRFLELSHAGVPIGDLAASEHLRWVRAGDGRLLPSSGLFLMLADCVWICEMSAGLEPPPDAAVFVLEPTYRHGVWQRVLHQRRLTQIDIKCWEETGFTFAAPGVKPHNPYRVDPPSGPLDGADREKAERYLAARLADPVAHIAYLETGHNDNTRADLTDFAGKPLVLDPAGVHVAVFLHSFDDAQYLFGNDGFAALMDWAVFSIEECLANPRIGRVLVKPHPATLNQEFPNTQRGEEFLRRRYEGVERVTWLEGTASLRALAAAGKVVGVTHHGSVAEELVFLGVPVIGYKHASWGAGYEFVRGWSTPSEYGQMLRDLDPQSFRPPAQRERESLLQYIRECRLVPGRGDFDYYLEFRRWLEHSGDARQAEGNLSLARHMDELRDEEAGDFLGYLLDSNS